jgi:1-acyl-sn-glycerol-3-phosphate acyltransferase
MSPLAWIATGITSWVLLVSFVHVVVLPRLSQPAGDPFVGLLWRFLRIAARVVHRLKITGLEHLPDSDRPGPMVVVCNHTGSIDPLLVSSICPFMIRWMMGDDLMWERMNPLWDKLQLIRVDRTGKRKDSIRTALRTLRNNGVIGIFPEGRITLPRGEIRPFFDGVGGLIARGKASTLLVWIEGTPETDHVLPSLLGRSHATVHFIEHIPYDGERDSHVIAERLREKLVEASGWKRNHETLPLVLPETGPF